MRIKIFLSILFVAFSLSSFAQKTKDKPKNGEGIQTFLIRNNRSSSSQYQQFLKLNKGKFGKNNTLIMGRFYALPPVEKKKETQTESNANISSKKGDTKEIPTSKATKGNNKRNKLYGKKYENFTVKSDNLKGACFFLSSGHGGPDPGSIGKINGKQIHEDEYAYDITLRLARILEEEGATVYMIIQDAQDGIRDDVYLANSKRETCMGQTIPLNQKARLKQRTDKINQLSAKSKATYKRGVFIHLDSRSHKQQLDVFFYYAPNSAQGKKLADTMKKTFGEQYGIHQPNRGFSGTVGPRDLYVLSKSNPVGIFAELGNIQNSFDQRRFLDPNNRQALAKWLSKGLIKDYNDSKRK